MKVIFKYILRKLVWINISHVFVCWYTTENCPSLSGKEILYTGNS